MEVTISKSNYTFPNVSTWLDKVGRTYENTKLTMWDFVMTLAAGIDQFGRTDPKREELFDLASQQTGLAKTTLKTYVSAARSPVASLAIEKDLTFQHARAVLGLREDVADSMLSDAVAGGWSPERLSSEAWAKKNGLPSPSQRTLTSNASPPAANGIAHRNGYHATDDRAEYLADDVPFSHARQDDDGPVVELWDDERIDSTTAQHSFLARDDNGTLWQVLEITLVQRLLRTMRDEFQLFVR